MSCEEDAGCGSDVEFGDDEVEVELEVEEARGVVADVTISATSTSKDGSGEYTWTTEGDGKRASQRCSSSTTSSTATSAMVEQQCRNASVPHSRPHKAHDAGWEAIRAALSLDGPAPGRHVGLAHFRFLQKLGSGDIGSVYLAQLRSSSCFFAIKVMDKAALSARNKLCRAHTEKDILQVLDHPFLPTLYAHIDHARFSCLVMEFCPGGDLHVLRQRQPMKRFNDRAVRFYAAEVLLALEYLHMMGIIYRDLKPENVLVREDGHIMLSDFDLSMKCNVNPTLARVGQLSNGEDGGASPPTAPCAAACAGASAAAASCILPLGGCVSPCSVHPVASCLPMPRILHFSGAGKRRQKPRRHHLANRMSAAHGNGVDGELPELHAEPTSARSMSFVGTHEYLAPEIILGEGHGSAVDWWTFGIFMFELLYGRTPFKGPDHELTLTNVVTQLLRFPSDDEFAHGGSPCAAAQDLIRGLLVKDPQKRIAATRGASEIKQHAFFQGVNWALIRCAIPPDIPSPYVAPAPAPDPAPCPVGAAVMDCASDCSADVDLARAWFLDDSCRHSADCHNPDYELF